MSQWLSKATTQKGFHGWMTVFWFLMIVPSLYFGWVTSVTYVSVLSIYALFIGHFSSWQAARVEVRQEQIESGRDNEAEGRIETKIDSIIS